jgi:VanZ family protein
VTGRPSGRPGAAGRSRRWWPPALWAAALLLATSWPNPSVPDVRQGDKGVHFLLYGGLAWLLARAEPPLVRRAGRLVATLAALSALAAADEWHQQFIPGRSASVSDWVADTTGATLALLLAAVRRRQPA